MSGSRTVFLEKWDPRRAVEVIRDFRVTSTAGAPTHLHSILELGCSNGELATLQEFLVGAAPVTEELGARAVGAGIATFRSYGSTEHPTVSGVHTDEPRWARLRTDGRPMPGSVVRIVAADVSEAPTDTDGEVVVRGPEQFVGYRDAQLDDEAFTDDGWFRTGDLGRLDADGRLIITDRIKDVIIRGGETISSAQVEDVLSAHPAVSECAVVAAPDVRFGEIVAAVVVLKPDERLDVDALRGHFAAAGLAKQKVPERLVVVDALPRTSLGKVRKAELRAQHFSSAMLDAPQGR
jgi:acyl-CoA synthetase (AMP-forming)/AMP-acid ligase II